MEQKSDGTKVVIGRCETIEEYRKKYYQKNKEKLNAYSKEWRIKNKEHIYAQLNQRVRCECGLSVKHRRLREHRKCSRHINRMDVIDQY